MRPRCQTGSWVVVIDSLAPVFPQSKKRNRKQSGDDSFDEGSVSESESESESGPAEEEKEETGTLQLFLFLLLCFTAWAGGERDTESENMLQR